MQVLNSTPSSYFESKPHFFKAFGDIHELIDVPPHDKEIKPIGTFKLSYK